MSENNSENMSEILSEKISENKTNTLKDLCETVSRLRAPDGCPWDRAQTHETLKAACIEEAAEVISGINILSETGKAECLCEELGDLLLQVVMHAQIAEEEGLFTLEDVIRTINDKMIRRHPHVFGREKHPAGQNTPEAQDPYSCAGLEQPACPQTADAVHADWKQIKSLEKAGREWEEPYLFKAFSEAEKLIDVARKRKQKDARQTEPAASQRMKICTEQNP